MARALFWMLAHRMLDHLMLGRRTPDSRMLDRVDLRIAKGVAVAPAHATRQRRMPFAA
jgi:hypothetical protein